MSDLIVGGILPKGTRLPSERVFSEALGVSRMTFRQAIDGVQSSGYIERVVGRAGGSFVTHQRPTVDISNLVGLSRQLLKTAGSATSEVLAAETLVAPERVAAALELGSGAHVHRIQRIRFADGVPVVLENSFFPRDLFPSFLEHDLAGSLYQAMDSGYGKAPSSAEEELRPSLVAAEDAIYLGIRPETPVLGIIRTARCGDGAAVEYSEDVFRTDRMRIVVSGTLSPERHRSGA
ncbi:GntR family transcriptional regulator [Pseudarthrobacter sp. P1]|uniref:GntR family transcriptional regulator n=1 Tax=Pseudarthrobacter sp. P1 TaxID=3418418 RepID=UPI003CF309F5